MNCRHCGSPLPGGSRRDRLFCDRRCRDACGRARQARGLAPLGRWRHPALTADDPVLAAAAARAQELTELHGWSPTTLLKTLDGLTAVLARPVSDRQITLSDIHALRGPGLLPGYARYSAISG